MIRSICVLAIAALASACDKPQADPAANKSAAPAKTTAGANASSAAATGSAAATQAARATDKLAAETWKAGELEWSARYQIYPALNVAMGAQQPGSIDAMVIDKAVEKAKVVLVEVRATGELGEPPRFVTSFTAPSGKSEKAWAPAAANKKGPFRALITAPADIAGAHTQLATP